MLYVMYSTNRPTNTVLYRKKDSGNFEIIA